MARRNRPNPRGATLRRKVYTAPGTFIRTEGTPVWSPLPSRRRCRIFELALYLKATLPRRKGTQGMLTAYDVLVLQALLFGFAHAATGVCLPAIPTIAAKIGGSEATVERALLTLRTIGLVVVHPRNAVYRIGNGYRRVPDRRRQRGTEIRVETSYAFTFPSNDALDDLACHLGRIVRRLASLGRRRGRQFDALTTPQDEGTKKKVGPDDSVDL